MGVVYLAHDPRVRRPVAIKTYHVPEGLSPEEEHDFQERFMHEAQAAGALTHPGIVTIFDAGEDPDMGTPFIAMEYVPGRSLKEILKSEGRIAPEKVFEMADTLAAALHAAHEAGVIHRDIKPANILVREPDDAIKIADFGVARLATSELTRSGHSLGSPAYMSPEQIRGGPVDGRSDLFSLAIILYVALCGERPFTGEDLSSLAYSVVHETPILISRRADGLPPGLDAFFDRALAKEPSARFPDGASFRQGLKALRQNAGPAASTGGACKTLEATLVDVTHPQPSERIAASLADASLHRILDRVQAAKLDRLGRRSVVVAALVLAAILGVWAFGLGGDRATLILEGENRLEAAALTLFVDGDKVYSRSLAAERKSARVFGKDLFKYGQENFEARIRVNPGELEVVADVVPEGHSSGYRDRAVIVLEPGQTRRLKLVTRRSTISLEPD